MDTNASTDRKQRLYPNTVRILNRLIETPATVKVLARELHMAEGSVQWAIDVLKNLGAVYVKSWHRSPRGQPARVWVAGQGKDAPKPEPLQPSVKSAAWRARGGDSHRAREIRQQAQKIAKATTLAGMLGL